jgi:hypothetical protein
MRHDRSKGTRAFARTNVRKLIPAPQHGVLLLSAALALGGCAAEDAPRGTSDALGTRGASDLGGASSARPSDSEDGADLEGVEDDSTDLDDDELALDEVDGESDDDADELESDVASDELDEDEARDTTERPRSALSLAAEAKVRELCVEDASDSDDDGLCDEAERHYKTDPDALDTDDDQLSDRAELIGMEMPGLGEDGASALLDLPGLGANPLHRDVFVEIDYYEGRRPSAGVQRLVVEAFARAPLDNPDGKRGITLHLVVADGPITDATLAKKELGNKDAPRPDSGDIWDDVESIKAKYADPMHKDAFYWTLFAETLRGGSMSGLAADFGSQDSIVTLGHPVWGTASDMMVAGTFMHELGHNLGLHHGGHIDADYMPNYFSVMNYLYQVSGVTRKEGDGVYTDVLDYSRLRVASISEKEVDEGKGLAPGEGSSEEELKAYGMRSCIGDDYRTRVFDEDVSSDVDFNMNGKKEAEPYAFDLNCGGYGPVVYPESQNDWLALDYMGGGKIGDVRRRERLRTYDGIVGALAPCSPLRPADEP